MRFGHVFLGNFFTWDAWHSTHSSLAFCSKSAMDALSKRLRLLNIASSTFPSQSSTLPLAFRFYTKHKHKSHSMCFILYDANIHRLHLITSHISEILQTSTYLSKADFLSFWRHHCQNITGVNDFWFLFISTSYKYTRHEYNIIWLFFLQYISLRHNKKCRQNGPFWPILVTFLIMSLIEEFL